MNCVLWNGQLKDSKEAVISAYDHGFLYGIGLFETFRTYGGSPWLIERHAARLAEGCRQLGIHYEPDPARMRDCIKRLLAANGLADGYIRWSVSAGEGIIGLPSEPYAEPQEIVYAKPLAPDDPASRTAKTLRLLRLRRTAPEGGHFRLKSFHFMNNIMGKRELLADGAGPNVEGLFLDAAGHVCEGLVSNVFWRSDDTLYTPSLETGALPGVTRQYVLEMALKSGMTVKEGRYVMEDLAAADEVFLTNSVQEIVPVAALIDADGRRIHDFGGVVPGPRTREWMLQYRLDAEGGKGQ
jgi:4-amino-4-deoxychorismate lyase